MVDFQENDMPTPWQAVLTVNVTLLDTDKENVADKVVFQRTYQDQEVMTVKTPDGLAEVMSAAMARVSRRVVQDVYRAVQTRLAKGRRSAGRLGFDGQGFYAAHNKSPGFTGWGE